MKQYKGNKFIDKETGLLVAFKLNKDLSLCEKTAFLRKVRGYTDYSQYGRYQYQRQGVLAKWKIPYYSPVRGIIVIRKKDFLKVKRLFSGKAQVYVWQVVLTKEDIKKMKITSNQGGNDELCFKH